MSSIRIITAIGGMTGFRLMASSKERVKLAVQAIKWTQKTGGGAIIFPAGFIRARTNLRAKQYAEEIQERANSPKVSVCLGIDTCAQSWVEDRELMERLTKEGHLPFFSYCYWPGSGKPVRWRQRSETSDNQQYADPAWCSVPRTMPVFSPKGKKLGGIEIITCGEAFNKLIREKVEWRASQLSAVAMTIHMGEGVRLWQPLSFFAKAGVPAFCSSHLKGTNGLAQTWFPADNDKGCKNVSKRDSIKVYGDDPFLELSEWKV